MEAGLRKLFYIILMTAVFISSSIMLSFSSESKKNIKEVHVIAYYFHGTFRCSTCRKLEQYSKEAIEANFNDAIASGKLEFKTVNVEDKGNEHYAKDYQLYTKSLILSLLKNGKEVKSENLSKIWEYVGNKQRFVDYVKREVADFLQEDK